ncbi:MAG TPA: cytidine deaminase [Muribaculaceae bacterium]|mgnify:FL=1|jgi:cytidine deaminase|nr:cytidine deaminase [Bacteroidales bacterium]MDD6961118.1 cytidine deaminase [Bacteroidales bacterium]MDY4156596.1 cytidine deaminase [Bacilli bacterium]MDY6185776.1 cytidine deaminase [Muribaculaceae bacterium]HRN04743.1 cytidine deaminase [Muribaculaceae bacterium]
MKDISITVPVVCYGYDELPDDAVRALVEKARQSTYHSYAPYSHFCVGAAILLDNGETITGANQENAAFSAGTCAERSACFYAHANYPEARFEAIAIAARAEDGDFVADPVSPCGVCRQALLEYEVLAKHPVPVWLAGRNCVYRLPSVASLLPLAFSEF